MNIFQQVFASVNPKAGQLVKASENVNENSVSKKEKETPVFDYSQKAKKTAKKEKKIKTSTSKDIPQISNLKAKIDFKISYQPQNNKTTKKKVKKSKESHVETIQPIQPIQQASENKAEDFDKDEILSEISQLEQKYEELCNQYNEMDESCNYLAERNEKLISENFDLELEIQKLKEGSKDSNNRFLDMKQELAEKAKEREESWEFKINELMMEYEVLKDSKK